MFAVLELQIRTAFRIKEGNVVIARAKEHPGSSSPRLLIKS